MGHASRIIAYIAAVAAVLPVNARAADDIATLRAELAALKNEYVERVSALETRIDKLESATSASPAVAELPLPTPSPPSRNSSAFNPAISVILAGNYASTSQNPSTYHIAGFSPSGDETGPGSRSFNLGESEITFAASVDPYFTANLTAALQADDSVGVEEAFFRTTSLPAGFSIKGGRFFSGIGYLNEIHAHAWDFADQPLAYQAFLGGQFAQDGVQVKWLAPTDMFLEFGAETGNGNAYPGTRLQRNGLNGVALFAHVGDDIGDSIGWRAGISWLDQDAEQRVYDDFDAVGNEVTNAFTGTSHTLIVDATLKWMRVGDPLRRGLKLQAEFLKRREAGELDFDTANANLGSRYHSNQSGWYVQGVYQFMPRWRLGLRYDALDSGTPRIGLVQSAGLPANDFQSLLPGSPRRVTSMLDWNPSEFSRLRLQLAWDDARDEKADRQLFLQYIYAIGAHGAHKF